MTSISSLRILSVILRDHSALSNWDRASIPASSPETLPLPAVENEEEEFRFFFFSSPSSSFFGEHIQKMHVRQMIFPSLRLPTIDNDDDENDDVM